MVPFQHTSVTGARYTRTVHHDNTSSGSKLKMVLRVFVKVLSGNNKGNYEEAEEGSKIPSLPMFVTRYKIKPTIFNLCWRRMSRHSITTEEICH